MQLAAAALREPLQKFLSVNSSYGSALRECYAAADSALDTFQQVLSRDSSVALAQLASALGVLSTTDAFAASRNRR